MMTIADVEGEIRITIADDGHGLPEGFDEHASSSLGLRLAHTLMAGQAGSFALRPAQPGTIAIITLRRQDDEMA